MVTNSQLSTIESKRRTMQTNRTETIIIWRSFRGLSVGRGREWGKRCRDLEEQMVGTE